MKKEKSIIRFFRNCNIEFTLCERHIIEGRPTFNFYKVKKEQVYVQTNSKNKSIMYFDLVDGFKACWRRKQKCKIFGGEEITIEQFKEDILNHKF